MHPDEGMPIRKAETSFDYKDIQHPNTGGDILNMIQK